MTERRRLPLKASVFAAFSLLGAAAVACNEGQETKPIVSSPTGDGRPTVDSTRETQPSVIPPTPQRTEATQAATQSPTREVPSVRADSNSAVRFGEGLRNWVEVADSESLRGLSQFTILARVKLDGIPPDAIVAKGDKVEAYALFATIASCLDGSMALVVDDKNYCSGIKVERNTFVNVAVTFNDGKAKFFSGDLESNEVRVDRKVSRENGSLFIGASPRGILNEGLSGQIDYLAIAGTAMQRQSILDAFNLLQKGDIAGFRSKVGDVKALYMFNGDYKDLSGHANDGRPFGAVSIVSLN